MTALNDVVWTEVEIPAKATPDTIESQEDSPPRSPEQGIKPEKASETPETPVGTDPEESMAVALEQAVDRLKRTFIPPDIVRLNRPSLLRVIAYAWAGDWGPKTGIWRTLGQLDAIFISVPLVAFFYSCAWIAERFMRRVAAALLITAAVWLLKSVGWL